MKIYPMNSIKKYTKLVLLAGTLSLIPVSAKTKPMEADTFIKTEAPAKTDKKILPPTGSTAPEDLAKAPSCNIIVQGKKEKATIVVVLATNTLYQYDKNGKPMIAYSIAKGKKSTPTHKGLRRVLFVDIAPYKKSPGTNRSRNPRPYGPRVIVLEIINPATGETFQTGEFIHGNGDNDTSMGYDKSGGCMRLSNKGAIAVGKYVKPGDYVLIK